MAALTQDRTALIEGVGRPRVYAVAASPSLPRYPRK